MKKNVLHKDFFMEIRKSMGRFVSIFFIVALGVAFYSGIRASEPSMRISGDAYFDKENLMDIKVMGSLGLTEEDIRAIGSVEGIELVEGGYSKDVLCPADDTEKVVHILSMQKSFNTVQVTEGRIPEKAGECLLDEDFLEYGDYEIGDTVTFRSGDDGELTDSLVTDTFTIVGIGNSPLYISFGRGNSLIGNGEVSGFVAVDESSFNMDVYTEAYVRVSGIVETIAFSDEYNQLSDAAVEALENIEEERCRIRREEILAEANEEIDDAQETLDEESEKLEDAKSELEDAKSTAARELEKARQELADGEAKLAESKQQIADGEAQLAAGKAELTRQQSTLATAKKEWEDGAAELSTKEAELSEGESKYWENYFQNMPLINAGKEKIESSIAEIEAGKTEIMQGLEPLKELRDGLDQTAAGLDDVKNKITAVSAQITEGEKRFQEYSEKNEEDLTSEQKEFLESWKTTESGLQSGLAELETKQEELQGTQASLLGQMQQAGFNTEQELADSITALETKLGELETNEKALMEKEKELLAQEQALLDAGEEIKTGKEQIAAARSQLSQAKAQIDAGESQLQAAWALLSENEQTLASGKNELAQGERELADGQSEYEQAAADAAQQISDGESQIAEGEEKLAEAKQEIADAKAEIEKIENPKWYVQSRSDALAEYDGYGENADRMRSIGQVFPVLFFLVAALISLTSMTRMVEEQRIQVGTMKALGYGKFAIAKKYICYALLATLGGSVIGVLIGEKIFPFIIIYAYKILYQHMPDILVPYHISYALQATLIAVFCTLIATMAACYKELAAQPAQLMRPPAPKQGKRILLERIGWFWRRLNFSWKSSVRNMIRYKKRFFMTIFGIGGCMALMVVGFGLKDCIYEIVTLQYEKIQFYDATAYMDDTISDEEREDILEYLDENTAIDDFIQTRMQKVKVRSEASTKSLYLSVPEDEEKIESFLSFHSRTTDEKYSLKDDQVILTEKIAQLLDVEVGDTITIVDEDKGDKEVQIGAVCENYMSHYLYLGTETYEEIYGALPDYNSVIYRVKDGDKAEIEQTGTELLSNENVLNVTYTSSIEERLDDMLESLNLVIVVLIVSAGMLAFVVLYNLNNINITERKRELATLKVLGFYDQEVATYVYRENVMLTFIGAVVGVVLGNILHRFVIVTVEVNEAMFGRDIHWQSYVYSFLFTVGFSIFVNLVMYFKLKKIDMVESLKSVE